MKLRKRSRMLEAAYAGNMGAMEMVRFMEVASKKQKNMMERYLEANKWEKAWSLLQKVTGMKLRSPFEKWSPKR